VTAVAATAVRVDSPLMSHRRGVLTPFTDAALADATLSPSPLGSGVERPYVYRAPAYC
jgi:hypothetical protein